MFWKESTAELSATPLNNKSERCLDQIPSKISPWIFLDQTWLKKKDVTSSEPPCKDGNTRFTAVPLKVLSDQVWTRYQCFCFVKLFILLAVFLQKWPVHRKTTIFSTIFIRLWFQRFRCESGIAIFAWRTNEIYT